MQGLLTAISCLTGKPRAQVVRGRDFEWSSNSWVHNIGRFVEMIFGREAVYNSDGSLSFAIRPESSSYTWIDEEGGIWSSTAFYTWEAMFAFAEGWIRGLIPRRFPFKVWIPVMQTPEGMPVFSSPFLFAIALDSAVADLTATGTSTSITRAHTCTGSNLILFSAVEANTTSDVVTGETYNSVAMTRINRTTFTNGGNNSVYLYYLLNPSTGTNNMVASASAANLYRAYTASYTGVKQSSQPDGMNTTNGASGDSGTIAITTTADNCWMVFMQANNAGEPTAGTNATRRSSSGGGGFAFFDSNGAITPAQSFSMQWVLMGCNGFGVCAASFAPAVSGPTNLKSFDGNTASNIKTFDGNTFANMKSLDGNS